MITSEIPSVRCPACGLQYCGRQRCLTRLHIKSVQVFACIPSSPSFSSSLAELEQSFQLSSCIHCQSRTPGSSVICLNSNCTGRRHNRVQDPQIDLTEVQDDRRSLRRRGGTTYTDEPVVSTEFGGDDSEDPTWNESAPPKRKRQRMTTTNRRDSPSPHDDDFNDFTVRETARALTDMSPASSASTGNLLPTVPSMLHLAPSPNLVPQPLSAPSLTPALMPVHHIGRPRHPSLRQSLASPASERLSGGERLSIGSTAMLSTPSMHLSSRSSFSLTNSGGGGSLATAPSPLGDPSSLLPLSQSSALLSSSATNLLALARSIDSEESTRPAPPPFVLPRPLSTNSLTSLLDDTSSGTAAAVVTGVTSTSAATSTPLRISGPNSSLTSDWRLSIREMPKVGSFADLMRLDPRDRPTN